MKKFLSLLSAAAIAVTSFATVASAAMTEDNFKPEWVVKVDRVEDGYAVIEVGVEVDKDLATSKSGSKYTGQAITSAELRLDFDADLFDPSDIGGDPVIGGADYNAVEDFYYVSFSWANAIANVVKTEDKYVTFGYFWALLNDADMTADEINALDFATEELAIIEIGDWQKVSAAKADITSYRSDGNGNFPVTVAIGEEPVTPPTPPAPTASVAITAAKKTTDANWIAENGNTMFWGVDFANGGFNGTAVAKIFSNDKERELTIATPADTAINGEASFGVFVIVGDSADALGLTVTSGDVTATAAPVAYADAE